MREKIKLESSAGTGHFYTTTKNKRTTPDKLEIKKYDPKARKHVMYKEGKLKSGSGKKVKSRKQAVAIALNEARQSGAKIPKKKKS